MQGAVKLEEVLALATQLSPLDKLRLIERIAPQLERELTAATATPHKSLRGLWKGIDISEDDIAEARREMWGTFPRQDI